MKQDKREMLACAELDEGRNLFGPSHHYLFGGRKRQKAWIRTIIKYIGVMHLTNPARLPTLYIVEGRERTGRTS